MWDFGKVSPAGGPPASWPLLPCVPQFPLSPPLCPCSTQFYSLMGPDPCLLSGEAKEFLQALSAVSCPFLPSGKGRLSPRARAGRALEFCNFME